MLSSKTSKKLSPEQREALFKTLKTRFEKQMNHHNRIARTKVQAKLEANPKKLRSLSEMDKSFLLYQ